MAMTKALHDVGVPLLIGTDITVEGMVPSHIQRELELLVEAGLTSFEALEAGTKNVVVSVDRMGRDCCFGAVEVGQRADLILLKGNPF
jgi:imidazolonepropionase-like amidohydrolase